MRIRTIVLAVALPVLAFGAGRLSAAGSPAVAGSLEPPGPPESTFSYSLEDIYNRLDTGAAGTQSTFAEPATGPTVGTGHTLNEIMAVAPAVDDTNGATQTHVLTGRTVWGLTSGQWGPMTGTMPNNGAVTIVPTTTAQTIVVGYHDGSGYVEGDADLVAGYIKDGVSVFGVDGTLHTLVPKTGQTISYIVGDDGDLQMGGTWPPPRFITSTAGIVTDTMTGLIWLQKANCGGTRTWPSALTFANLLYDGWTGDGSGGDCGLSDGSSAGDWRLPNLRELHSLVHYGFYDPPVPNTAGTGKWTEGDPFTGVQSDNYWSSTTDAVVTNCAWYVSLDVSYVMWSDKTNTSQYVWPVRGGQ